MKIAFHIAHPSQFYIFDKIIEHLPKTHEIIVTYNVKDVVEDLIINSNLKNIAYRIEKNENYDSNFSQIKKFLNKEIGLFKILKKFKPNLIVGTSVIITHIAKLVNAKNIILNEDDFDIITSTAKIGYPFADHILSPDVIRTGKWGKKVIKYKGYQKLIYLHPNVFIPQDEILKNYIDLSTPFFLIRFAKLKAHHDKGIKGLDIDIVRRLIQKLKLIGNVYISSEIDLPIDLELFSLKIPAELIHTLLYHSKLLISDSQSMSVEAAMLGTPSIRVNDFVGRISVLEELENKYGLTFGIKPNQPLKILEKTDQIISKKDIKERYYKKKDIMISEKMNVLKYMVWFIDKYPESILQLKQNPEDINKQFINK